MTHAEALARLRAAETNIAALADMLVTERAAVAEAVACLSAPERKARKAPLRFRGNTDDMAARALAILRERGPMKLGDLSCALGFARGAPPSVHAAIDVLTASRQIDVIPGKQRSIVLRAVSP